MVKAALSSFSIAVLATASIGGTIQSSIAAGGSEDSSPTPGISTPSGQSRTFAAVESVAASDPAPVAPVEMFSGRVGLSVDGTGSTSATSLVEVEKPAGATVRAAYLAAASTGFSGYLPNDGDVQLAGTPVTWDAARTMRNSIGSTNVWGDVTSIVKPLIDPAPEGRNQVIVDEGELTGSIDGVILAVVFDDPQAVQSTVVLAYGAQQVTGDRIQVGAPMGPANREVTLGLGVSFGYQPAGQYSTVEVNGSLITSSAGGQDDGESSDGALITVGGLGDDRANPSDPTATDSQGGCPRCDDELYSLEGLLAEGNSSLSLTTSNPSADDNVFFASLLVRGAQATWTPSGGRSLNYVALGDSYSSGEGAGAGYYFQTNGKDIKCHRAPTAWSFVVAESSAQIADPMQNFACTGAKTQHVQYEWYKGEQPQVQALKEYDNALRSRGDGEVDLVTVTIGGNDAGFGGIVRDCYLTDCAKDATKGNWRKKWREAARVLAQEIVPKMQAAAPNARIVIVGYPRLLPEKQSDVKQCGWLTSDERKALNKMAEIGNKYYIDAIFTERFENPGYVAPDFISPLDALDGHELCTTDSHVVKIYGNARNSEQGHPTVEGQKDYARIVTQGLKELGIITE